MFCTWHRCKYRIDVKSHHSVKFHQYSHCLLVTCICICKRYIVLFIKIMQKKELNAHLSSIINDKIKLQIASHLIIKWKKNPSGKSFGNRPSGDISDWYLQGDTKCCLLEFQSLLLHTDCHIPSLYCSSFISPIQKCECWMLKCVIHVYKV